MTQAKTNGPAAVTLNDGHQMPQLGFGVFKIPPQDAARLTREAIETGYRAIDTAAIYNNEQGVGEALAQCGVDRDDMFVTTKLWNDNHAAADAEKAFTASLKKLGLAYVDLYLIHWPAPQKGSFIETWKALVRLQKEGLARSIGVSNFMAGQLTAIIDGTGVVPSVNQIELHPGFQQRELRDFHAKHGIMTECWSPLGQGAALKNPVIGGIAKRLGKTPAQVILRWHLDLGFIAIPKSSARARMAENFAVFDFTLSREDHASIARLDQAGGRIGPDPLTFG